MSEHPENITIRDWYAAMAMAALVASPKCPDHNETIAVWAYEMADALIAARDAKPEAQP